MRLLSEVSHVVVGYDFVGRGLGYHTVIPGIPLIPRILVIPWDPHIMQSSWWGFLGIDEVDYNDFLVF